MVRSFYQSFSNFLIINEVTKFGQFSVRMIYTEVNNFSEILKICIINLITRLNYFWILQTTNFSNFALCRPLTSVILHSADPYYHHLQNIPTKSDTKVCLIRYQNLVNYSLEKSSDFPLIPSCFNKIKQLCLLRSLWHQF